jgi:CHASE2 domain-containing sensor protein
MPETRRPDGPPGAETIIRWIMAALVVWGVFHAVGAWTLNHDPRRALVVLACMAAFLGFWAALLGRRRGRLSRAADSGARK